MRCVPVINGETFGWYGRAAEVKVRQEARLLGLCTVIGWKNGLRWCDAGPDPQPLINATKRVTGDFRHAIA